MSGRVTIDHINNSIVIQPNIIDLSTMSNYEILKWVREFILALETSSFRPCRAGDIVKREKVIPMEFNPNEFRLDIIDEYI